MSVDDKGAADRFDEAARGLGVVRIGQTAEEDREFVAADVRQRRGKKIPVKAVYLAERFRAGVGVEAMATTSAGAVP